jgi:prophage regulatory protein
MQKIIRHAKLSEKFDMPKSTVHHQIKHGLLPKPIKIGPRAVGFLSNEIDAVMNARIAGKSDAQVKAKATPK